VQAEREAAAKRQRDARSVGRMNALVRAFRTRMVTLVSHAVTGVVSNADSHRRDSRKSQGCHAPVTPCPQSPVRPDPSVLLRKYKNFSRPRRLRRRQTADPRRSPMNLNGRTWMPLRFDWSNGCSAMSEETYGRKIWKRQARLLLDQDKRELLKL